MSNGVVERWKDADLEVEVDKWFDTLDLKSVEVIQRVLPGQKTLQEALKVLNEKTSKQITRGLLVASIWPEAIAQDIRDLLIEVGKKG